MYNSGHSGRRWSASVEGWIRLRLIDLPWSLTWARRICLQRQHYIQEHTSSLGAEGNTTNWQRAQSKQADRVIAAPAEASEDFFFFFFWTMQIKETERDINCKNQVRLVLP